MSTLKTVNIQHPSASTPSITLDSTGAMIGSFPYPNRNLFINGSMNVWQRGTSAVTATASATTYLADRWKFIRSASGSQAYTYAQATDAPSSIPSLKYSAKITVTASSAPGSADMDTLTQVE